MIKKHVSQSPLLRLAAMVAAFGAVIPSPARADVKMVVEVTTTGGPVVSPNQGTADPIKTAWTVYFRTLKARREEQDGHIVTIYDKEADKVYTIDKTAKTYYVTPYKQARDNGSGYAENDPVAAQMNVDTNIDLNNADNAPDLSRIVAGVSSTKYTLFAEVNGSAKEHHEGSGGRRGGGGGGGGGRRGGGGGFPLQGGSGGGQRRGQAFPHTSLSGDVWLADAQVLLPDVKKDERDLSISWLQEFLPGYSPLLDPLSGQLAKKHLLPLASHLTLRLYNGFSAPVSDGGVENPSGPALATVPLTIMTVVTAIDAHATLDDALFQIPGGFDRVSTPAPVAPLPSSQGGQRNP